MGLFENIKRNKLLKLGYSNEQVKAIIYASNNDILNYIDNSYSIEDIYEIGKLLNSDKKNLLYVLSKLDNVKKMLIIDALNKEENVSNDVVNFLVDVAGRYDVEVLKVAISNLVCDSPNRDFMELVKTAIHQDVNIYNLKYFEDIKTESKKMGS